MTNVTMKSDSFEPATDTAAHLFDNWFDPIESGLRERVREFIEALICGELDAALGALLIVGGILWAMTEGMNAAASNPPLSTTGQGGTRSIPVGR